MQKAATKSGVISARELQQLLHSRTDLVIIDVRNRDAFETWKLESRHDVTMINVPYFELIEAGGEDDMVDSVEAYARKHWADELPKESLVVVVCAQEGTSALVADALRRLDYETVVLEGGMGAWGDYYDVRPVVESDALSVYQMNRPARGCLSYMVASAGQAVVIDPLRHTEPYVEFAREKGWDIVHVFDTHGHADHISGGPALARELNVPYHLHPYDAIHPLDVMPATVDYEPLQDGAQFTIGQATMRAVHVPGHTLGNMVFIVNEAYAFTGDTIFIESVARPDLGGRGDTWAPLHYESLTSLLALPDETVVLPGHFSSPKEADADGLYAGTLGSLKQSNDGLQRLMQGEGAFVDYILANLPTFPEQYIDIKRVNAGLLRPDEETAAELELGRNICALSEAYDE